MYTAEELAKQLQDSKARFILTLGPFLDCAREAADMVGGIDEIFTFDGAEGTTPFAELLEAEELIEGPEIDPENDLVALPYSSGTTGISKGVMLTHRNLVANMCQIAGTASRAREITEADTLVAVLPFYHIYGMGVIMNYALSKGASIVILPRFDLESFLKALQDYGVTFAHVVPPILLAIAKHPIVDEFDLSKIDVINSGAAPLGKELALAVEERLGCLVCQGYGLTETSPVTHSPRNKVKGGYPHASIGPALPNTEMKIVDTATGEELGRGERGELWIRGPQVMKGYLGQTGATAATIDEDGFLHTGDVAYVDEDDHTYIVDRVKELIKYKGYQVPPAELEAILLSNPHIRDAAVVRSPDEEAGEVPKAFVVSDGSLSDQDVMDFVAEHVSPQKKVRRVEFVDEIPKSASGKILRRVLIDREIAAMEQSS
jgi:acyl-CoA synthetase (AMP-forming)/AMP-acid ligase II